jgi:hypothetical protein
MASKEWDNTEDSVYLNFGRLTWHVSKKGFQLGSFIGIAIVTPIALYRTRGKPFSDALPQILRYQGTSAIAGVSLGGAMEANKMRSYNKAGDVPGALQDRAYRLHYNKGQNRADFFSHLGSSIGILSTWYWTKAAGVLGLVGGASVGAALGVLAHVATMEKKQKGEEEGNNKMIDELHS